MKNCVLILSTFLLAITGLKAQTYSSTATVSGLAYPVAFTFTPDGRYLVTQKAGLIKIFNPDGSSIGTFYSLTDSTFNDFERGLLGIDVDPDFANNHYVYIYYNHRYPNNSSGTASQQMRVVRFTEVNNVGTNPTVLFSQSPGSIAGNHVGGNLHFRPTDPTHIYFTIGDIAVTSNGQLNDRPYGKFLRINKADGSIPTDNPFYDDGVPTTGNDDRIWSTGHRNPFDFCFSPINDSLYSSENGLNTWDELNIVTHGKNYGWGTCEGYYLINSTTSPCTNPAFTRPIQTWAAPLPAVTGIMHYNSCFMPELTNHLLVADNDNGYIYNLTMGNAPAYDTVLSRTLLLDVTDHLTTLKQGTDGYIYALQGGYVASGKIFKIGPATPPVTPVANIGASNWEFCLGEGVSLSAQFNTGDITYKFNLIGGDTTYTISSNSNVNNITPTISGTFDLQLIVSNGCQSDTDFVVNYVTFFDPPIYTLNYTNSIVGGPFGSAWISNYSNINGTAWLDANLNPVPFASFDSVYNLQPGTYYIDLTNGSNIIACEIIDTVVISLISTINENAIQPIKIFPNPANDRLFVDLNNASQQSMTAQVYNAMGALVLTQAVNGKALAELNVATLPAGIYYMRIVAGNSIYAAKWTKQ